jgi:hypothetical protein
MMRGRVMAWMFALFACTIADAGAQEADPLPTKPDTTRRFPNTTAGEFTPGTGYTLIKTEKGSLNISVYGLFRHVNQLPGAQSFVDHLGRRDTINTSNDLTWHRTLIWISGFFYDPRFRYTITAWSLPTTQQALVFGNLQFLAADWLVIGVGLAPSLTARSMQGSWPFWAGSDRQMAEEFFRGGFSSGLWLTGNIRPKLTYTLSINNNISQLGVVQSNDTRAMAYTASMRWQPTTGEFGPRNGFGDLENHTKIATQFGFSSGSSRESRYAPLGSPPNNTQIKISDGLNPFTEGALADGVTVTTLDYGLVAIDAGAKYRGFSLEGEYYWRQLNDFVATGPLPVNAIKDHGFMARAGYMVIPKKLMAYVVSGYVDDQFKRYPYEAGGGLSFYPFGNRNLRVNGHFLHIDKSPASSSFGYYLAGLKGTIISFGVDILL